MDNVDNSPFDIKDFYTRFYQAIAVSPSNALYCERLYGKNLCQQGFAEVAHIEHLARVAGLAPGVHALDLGCGNGLIAAYLAEQNGASIVGIDNIPEAIRQANARPRHEWLQFEVMDIANLTIAPASFDVVMAIDTLYFTPLEDTLRQIFRLLKPGGRLVTFWSQSCEPWKSLETFDKTSTRPENTDLARALPALGLTYEAWDYTEADYQHALRKRQIAEELQPAFIAEGNAFLVEGYLGEAGGVRGAYENGAHGRYLYQISGV